MLYLLLVVCLHGAMVKRLRLRPFKAATRVRVPLALPDMPGAPSGHPFHLQYQVRLGRYRTGVWLGVRMGAQDMNALPSKTRV